ncbi:glycosyltransferase involved in cell wall biosynthesis [Mucilaginibacter yixingensis]|uniref:Glycosyltransferase involved in cell wall biosynthesis n=1 Tax=Mucilaginibacter yixingensis TaxID=1295612 RepID=A0A2T5JBY6_9SPHI|nr:glycosyltransferase family 1 protein [Mucilaginibacter yixingensis]PTQ99292.1 glycosyltransferase involved in cell wall biosynthesis [Mucilaginibacter yixingensis]
MVKVLFDHQKFSEQRYGGITRYFAALIDALKTDPEFDYRVGALYSNNYYIRNEHLPLNNFVGRWLLDGDARRQYKWNKQYSKRAIGGSDYDVFHPTYFHPYFLKRVKKPYVITMHDMIYEALPEYFTNTDITPRHKQQTTERADAVIAISESTRRDLMQLLNIPAEKITMIHHGLDLQTPLQFEPVPGLPENYILFVGERGNYKNFFRFAEACAQLLREYPDLHVVLAGGGQPQVADALAIQRLHLNNRCHQYNVTDAQLNYLYQHAQVFVFPSLYEGFGYPLLEAFKAGAPVAASNTSCFPEIGGDAVQYFNPYETAEIYQAIKAVLDDSTLRTGLINKGGERLKLFPVEKQKAKTLELYRKVAGK